MGGIITEKDFFWPRFSTFEKQVRLLFMFVGESTLDVGMGMLVNRDLLFSVDAAVG